MVTSLRRKENVLRKAVLESCQRPLKTPGDDLIWSLLGELTRDCTELPLYIRNACESAIEHRSVDEYMELQKYADPLQYESAAEFYSATSVVSFLKKYPFGKVANLDPLGAALTSSNRAEKLCRMTNRRLLYYRNRGYRHSNRWRGVHSILHTARLLISRWLDPLDLNTVYDHMRHGPGGAIGVTGRDTTAYFKYAASSYTVTTRALPYAEAAILSDPLWRRYVVNPSAMIGDPVPSVSEAREATLKRLKVVDYNKVTYVPKTAQTHRAIAIEPLLNIYLQLGVGDFITEKLRSAGINLRSQLRNQRRARDGSQWEYDVNLRPVTLDLSMASDTLAYELVRELLPEDWFEFLCCLRSPYGRYGETEVRWAKFSSMGNGFTFQLESLIFYALSLSVAKHLGFDRRDVLVYGDDIIIPAGMALRLVDVLAYCGFSVNNSKSFFFGPFRESCGSDWFEGRYVRPFFLKRKIQNAQDLIFIYNSFRVKDRLLGLLGNGCGEYQNICSSALSQVPKIVKDNLLGPVVQDLEGHIFARLDEASKSHFVRWRKHDQVWSYASVKASPRFYRGDVGPLYLQLMGQDSSGRGDVPPNVDPSYQALLRGLSTIGSRKSSVVRRDDTKSRLATRTSDGWRND